MISIYPSRLPGMPLEMHEHGITTIHDWLVKNVEDYGIRDIPPISVDVNGIGIPQQSWSFCVIKPESDVRFYPVPFATAAAVAAWAALAIAAASAVYVLITMSNMDSGGYSSSNGRSLDLNPAKANQAKLGDPIRELFGRYRIYPDYVVSPVTRFDPVDPTIMRVSMLVCLGMGNFSFSNGDLRIGDTPASTLEGFNYICSGTLNLAT